MVYTSKNFTIEPKDQSWSEPVDSDGSSFEVGIKSNDNKFFIKSAWFYNSDKKKTWYVSTKIIYKESSKKILTGYFTMSKFFDNITNVKQMKLAYKSEYDLLQNGAFDNKIGTSQAFKSIGSNGTEFFKFKNPHNKNDTFSIKFHNSKSKNISLESKQNSEINNITIVYSENECSCDCEC